MLLPVCALAGAGKKRLDMTLEAWRQAREDALRAEDGWLSLVGLHWLRPGQNRVGSDAENQVRLPASVASRVGTFTLVNEAVRFQAEPGVDVRRGKELFLAGQVQTDEEGKKPDVLTVGTVRMMVIKRGDRLALRVKDSQSPVRTEFQGLRWYPLDPNWRVHARFEPTVLLNRLEVETVVGTRESFESPGFAVFERDGKTYRLQLAMEGEKYWVVFRDGTAGKTTPANGRQLLVDPPDADGILMLDFNRAVNLPCAYTPFATCPQPPKVNRLDFPIPAGEQEYQSPSMASLGAG